MSSNDPDLMRRVTRHGSADVAFLGVEIKDTFLLIGSVFVGLIAGSKYGLPAYFGCPFGGYILTRLYLDWKSGHLPGMERAWAYSIGLLGYSSGLDSRHTIYHGDAVAINPQLEEQEFSILLEQIKEKNNGSGKS
ncbi:hypothetical protein DBR42_00840 [Pelomonas sp. HMWF004]|nr:hypothetical protein DBR42_00840 [Pelomonas sp. HMWF004]